jgi:hypothetical protein
MSLARIISCLIVWAFIPYTGSFDGNDGFEDTGRSAKLVRLSLDQRTDMKISVALVIKTIKTRKGGIIPQRCSSQVGFVN